MFKKTSNELRIFARSVGQLITENEIDQVSGAGPINDSTTWTRLGCSGGVCTDVADDSWGLPTTSGGPGGGA